jgi:hypothetical protein
MTSRSTVADIFGDSIAERIERAREQRWRITSALTTDFTTRETNPPEGVSKRKRTRVQLGSVSRFIIRKAQSEYRLNNETETVKKLLRNGLQEIYLEWGEEISKLAEIDDAITHSSGYIQEDITLLFSDEDWDLSIEPNTSSDRYYIFWYQEFYAEKLSRELNIPKSHVLQLGILMAGRSLRGIDDIPAEKGRKIEEIVKDVDEQIERRTSNLEQLAFGAMITAWDTTEGADLHSKLQAECPNVLDSFGERITRLSEYFE